MNVFRQRGSVGAVLRVIPFEIPTSTARAAAGGQGLRRPAPRPRARDRPDRVGQVDHVGLAARHHQPHQGGPHHVVRGPDRVPPHPPAGDRQPARGRPGHPQLRLGAQAGAARGPRRDPRRRDARPGDDPHGAHRGRDRSPRLRHAAHPVGTSDRRPHRRRLPARAAGPDPGDAGHDAAGASSPSSCSHGRRQRPGASARRGAGRHPRRAQPDPGGQGLPDPDPDAGRRAARDGHDGPEPGGAGPGRDASPWTSRSSGPATPTMLRNLLGARAPAGRSDERDHHVRLQGPRQVRDAGRGQPRGRGRAAGRRQAAGDGLRARLSISASARSKLSMDIKHRRRRRSSSRTSPSSPASWRR